MVFMTKEIVPPVIGQRVLGISGKRPGMPSVNNLVSSCPFVIGQHVLGVTGKTPETRLIEYLDMNCPLAFLDVCCWKNS